MADNAYGWEREFSKIAPLLPPLGAFAAVREEMIAVFSDVQPSGAATLMLSRDLVPQNANTAFALRYFAPAVACITGTAVGEAPVVAPVRAGRSGPLVRDETVRLAKVPGASTATGEAQLPFERTVSKLGSLLGYRRRASTASPCARPSPAASSAFSRGPDLPPALQ